jgi:hypothetical protein
VHDEEFVERIFKRSTTFFITRKACCTHLEASPAELAVHNQSLVGFSRDRLRTEVEHEAGTVFIQTPDCARIK